jgi:hypothetical protein
MSLDISLISDQPIKKESSGIFIRSNGQTKEISIEEWNAANPDREPVRLVREATVTNEVYTDNITHNLGSMAAEAGIYKHLWRPEEINITKANELIEPLRHGLHSLKMDPERFKKLNPENGWGTYEGLIQFVENYLNACYQYPDTNIEVSR